MLIAIDKRPLPSGHGMRRHDSRRPKSSLLLTLLVSMGLCTASLPSHGYAEEASQAVSIGAASVRVPTSWRVQREDDVEMGGMSAHLMVLSSPDGRVSTYLLVIDPFGVDIETWSFEDLLAPTLVDLLAFSGASAKKMRIRETSCEMGGEAREGRLIIRPFDDQDEPRLVAGMACGVAEPSRWAAAFVVVEANYDRPLLLRRDLEEAHTIVRSFRFE